MHEEGRVSISVGAGAIAGFFAWILGYLGTALVATEELRGDVVVELVRVFADDPGDWQLVGFLFYNGHYVDILLPDVMPVSSSYNHVTASDGVVGSLLFLPPALLVVAGAIVAARSSAPRGDPARIVDGAMSGATVIVGYLPPIVLGLLVFTIAIGDGTARPDPIRAVLLAGLVYPIVFGGLGGALAGALLDRTD